MLISAVTPHATTAPASTATQKPAAASGLDGLANESTFLKLLMAQIRNQNPLNPTDGTQFLTQLAQFSSLEQNLKIETDLKSINSTLDNRLPVAPAPTPAPTPKP